MDAAENFLWTDLALEELSETVEYLRQEFSEDEVEILANEIERFLEIILHNPSLFPLANKNNVRKAVILKYNSMYYRILNNKIEILSFFSNRKNPSRRKL